MTKLPLVFLILKLCPHFTQEGLSRLIKFSSEVHSNLNYFIIL